MVTLAVTSPYMYVATGFFGLSSVTSDLLLIRINLSLAYAFLVLAAGSGYTKDGSFGESAPLRQNIVDLSFWFNLVLFCGHFTVTCRLIHDEVWPLLQDRHQRRKQRLQIINTSSSDGGPSISSSDRESLFYFFRARCGMTRIEFDLIYAQGEWLTLHGRNVEVPACACRLYLTVDGVLDCQACYFDKWSQVFSKRSGQFFDVKLFNVFSLPIGFNHAGFRSHTKCETTTLFYWNVSALDQMSNHPVLQSFWEFVILKSISAVAIQTHLSDTPCATLFDSLHIPEDVEWIDGARSRDFLPRPRPPYHALLLGDDANPNNDTDTHYNVKQCTNDLVLTPLKSCWCGAVTFVSWIWCSITFLPPAGIRHRPGALYPNPQRESVLRDCKRRQNMETETPLPLEKEETAQVEPAFSCEIDNISESPRIA
eukprot:CAMPEP_0198283366 /NCGR_PEP_ID=MMETSP1449-20131203/2981_1 /TAXON_ID=420275 /ORGANISM="Attheya septentrionalis, Strain CCMP2084" /LENGTH=424 /DNA_ID=CAMNT_0043979951 /DNA_START=163 /DNA_END=1437 /DNA_ORIENTATION=-